MKIKEDAKHTVKATIGNIPIFITEDRKKQILNLQKIIKEQREKKYEKI